MKREELKEYLPHREPMLLVDEIEIDDDGICHATYEVRGDEFFCQGHFPDNPVVPGVILCEIMAQSCALLVKDEIKEKLPLYNGEHRPWEFIDREGYEIEIVEVTGPDTLERRKYADDAWIGNTDYRREAYIIKKPV